MMTLGFSAAWQIDEMAIVDRVSAACRINNFFMFIETLVSMGFTHIFRKVFPYL